MIKVTDMRVLEHILLCLKLVRSNCVTEGALWEKEMNGKARHAVTNAINHHRQTYHVELPDDALCGACGRPARYHAWGGPLGCGGVPYLRRLCDGTLVKLFPPGPRRFDEPWKAGRCPAEAVTRLRAQVEAAGLKWEKELVRLHYSGVSWTEGGS